MCGCLIWKTETPPATTATSTSQINPLYRSTQPHFRKPTPLNLSPLFFFVALFICDPISNLSSLPPYLFYLPTLILIIFSFICSGGFIIYLGINTLTGFLALLHRFLLLGFVFLLKRQEGLNVWSFGLLINLLLTVCPLVTCVLEKDEAAIESSEFNATSVADVDKRVKRRLLMGNSFLPLSMCCHGACACIPDSTPLRSSLFSFLCL